MRKRVLDLRQLFFGGSNEEQVSNTEMFYLVFMYFSFPNKPLWLSDAPNSSADYCYRTFIARLTGDPWLGWLRFPSLSSIMFLPENSTPIAQELYLPRTYLPKNCTSPSIYLPKNCCALIALVVHAEALNPMG
ncbi:hypothetical protein AMTRI_Chr09g19960 [Amborella trichopoda]